MEWQAGISNKTFGLFLSINLISLLFAVGCGLRERSRVGSAAAGGAQLRALAAAAQAEHSHRGQLNAGIVSAPSLRGWERGWGAGRAE